MAKKNEKDHAFADVVRDICDGARGGTLFIRTSDNRSARLLFEGGKIAGAHFGPFKGRKAISMLRMSDGITCRFEEGLFFPTEQDLRSHDETMAELFGGISVAATPVVEEPEPAVARSPSSPRGPSSRLGLGNVISQVLARGLAKYIGPAALGVIGDAERDSLNVASHDEMVAIIGKLSADLLEPRELGPFTNDITPQIDRLFSKGAINVIGDQMVESIGPVGRGVFERVLADSGGAVSDPAGMERLIVALVEEIDDPGEARQFVARLRGALEALVS